MITQSKTRAQIMAADEELKKLIEDLKRELGGKIDKLSKQLLERRRIQKSRNSKKVGMNF